MSPALLVRFWGVRGSIATASARTAQVGGNTSCVEVRAGDTLFILDAGTGLRPLGDDLMRRRAQASSRAVSSTAPAAPDPIRAHLLLSHFHWDHIQGFPFFTPAYVPGSRIEVIAPAFAADEDHDHRHDRAAVHAIPRGPGVARDVRAAFEAQMRPPHFPVGLDAMRADLSFRAAAPGEVFQIGAATVRAASAHHPNGCLAWRIDFGGRSLVYATDTEHHGAGAIDESLAALAEGADVLVYDAQYTPAEYQAGKRGWGHSTYEEGARLARAAGVGQLVLFHHDPSHDDWEVARIEAAAAALFSSTVAAREGLEIALAPPAEARAA